MSVKRGAPVWVAVAAPFPAEELGQVVRARENGIDRGAADGEENPDEREQQPDPSKRLLAAERDRAEMLGFDAVAEEECAADDHQREREEPAEAVADDRVRAVEADVLGRPPSSTPPDE